MSSLAITCTACGEASLLRRESVVDGFKIVGERLFCSACGHEYESEAQVPFRKGGTTSLFSEGERPKTPTVFSDEDRPMKPSVFSESDKSKVVDIFQDDEKGRNCRHCVHYVVNPFSQRCGLHEKPVEATDICFDFEAKPDKDSDASSGKT